MIEDTRPGVKSKPVQRLLKRQQKFTGWEGLGKLKVLIYALKQANFMVCKLYLKVLASKNNNYRDIF
jgi:hypothetical protein